MKALAITLGALMVLSSCSKGSGKSGGFAPAPVIVETKEPHKEPPKEPQKPEEIKEESPEMQGQYLAVLQTLNAVVAERVTGSVTISRDNDELAAFTKFFGGPLTASPSPEIDPEGKNSTLHGQYVHEGTRCPTLADDTNNDGYIDAKEGQAVYGKVLIPLDADLNSQSAGLYVDVAADQYGTYKYRTHASYSKFIEDLKDIGNDHPADNYLKINEEFLDLRGKVVIITGVKREANLPPTVGSNIRVFANFQTLPVACGIFSKVKTVPGTIGRDEPRAPFPDPAGGDFGTEDGTIIPVPNADGTITRPVPTPIPTTPPVEETTPPVEETTPPVEETTPPVEETTPPVEETTPPVEETTPPVEETTPPNETVPEVETTPTVPETEELPETIPEVETTPTIPEPETRPETETEEERPTTTETTETTETNTDGPGNYGDDDEN